MKFEGRLAAHGPSVPLPDDVAASLPKGSPQVRDFLECTTDCVFLLDAEWRFTYVNRRAADEIGRGRDLIDQVLWEMLPRSFVNAFGEEYQSAMIERKQVRFETYFQPLETWYEIQASPLHDGGIGVWFRNINERKQAEKALADAEERYRLAASVAADFALDWDLATNEVRWSGKLAAEIDPDPKAIKSPEVCLERIHPDDRDRIRAEMYRHLKESDHFSCEGRFLRASGDYVTLHQRAMIDRNTNGQATRVICTLQDVTEQRRASEELRQRESKLANIFGQALVGIMECDRNGRIRMINGRFCQILDRTEAELKNLNAWEHTHPDDVEWNRPLFLANRARAEPFQTEKRYLRPDGTSVWCRVSISFVLDAAGNFESTIVVAEDITAQREAAAKLKWASEHDALTELPNRRAFQARLQATILRAMESDGQVGLLLVDLDHFKHVNDTLGHSAGDQLLVAIAERLQRPFPHNAFVARLGGDEFAVLLEGAGKGVDLQMAGNATLGRLQMPVQIEGRSISVSASIGGAVFPHDAGSANELVENADIALYTLKASGRGGTKAFEQHMRQRAQIVSSQLSLARVSVTEESVEPHYQQKVDLRSGAIVGFEALLRWRHSLHGIQTPASVAEAFKDYELASKIGELVQERVFRDLRSWLKDGLSCVVVAINAAPVEFLRDDFAERLIARMKRHDIPPHLVEIEVTEHVFLDRESNQVKRALTMLHEAGIRIALDDFGTGYSSLSHLRDFPVDVVKIDRSFVARMGAEQEIRAIVAAVVGLARNLKSEVVAEGIETHEQKHLLLGLGCERGQGYLFGPAVAADRVAHLLDRPGERQSCAA